ncbi:metastasis-suppressor KiSS-1 [Bombina bombina]|uniref:metastasis-suppressor KiSS-1 n=1 Tax=Bombina bombina TaxID=8345 RepID=UPI00235AA78C|nr:metastasis-suppressor KiSS-1 [Bombina bombina]
MIRPDLSLLTLLLGIHALHCAEDPALTSKLTAFPADEGSRQFFSPFPCPEKMPAVWKAEQTPVLTLLCRRKKLLTPGQLWSADPPIPSRAIPAPEGEFLVEREKDLSTYNWNSFGLRYGKRKAETVYPKMNVW